MINNCIKDGTAVGVIFLGPGNSGKGTQGKMLVEKYAGHHISTGDLIRDRIARDSDFARQYSGQVGSGSLVTDEVVLDVIKEHIVSVNPTGIVVLDGLCRTGSQVNMLNNLFFRPDHLIAFNFVITLDVVRQRAEIRDRDDDSMIDKRFKIWSEHRTGVIKRLVRKGVHVFEVDACQDKEIIHDFIADKIVYHGKTVKGLVGPGARNRHRPATPHHVHHV